MTDNRQNPYEIDAPRVKVAAKAGVPNVLPVLILVLGVVVLLISGAASGI